MPDINEWRLEYPGTVFNFGTLDDDYPFKTQVEFSDTALDTQDQRHPSSDGVVMGIDSLGGFNITFDITTIPDFPLPNEPWNVALNLFSTMKAAWRADAIRQTPGKYATLTNLNRNRLVYGRPRKIAPKNSRLRQGFVGIVSTFETNDPNFYDATEKLAIITPVPPPAGGFTAPLTPPLSTAGSAAEIAATNNNGDLAAWPVIKFHGPGTFFSLSLLDGLGNALWTVTAVGQINYDQIMVIDTRPWARSATINGMPANGRLRGTALEQCRIPVGDFELQFKVTDSSGTAFADIRWRDAYASL